MERPLLYPLQGESACSAVKECKDGQTMHVLYTEYTPDGQWTRSLTSHRAKQIGSSSLATLSEHQPKPQYLQKKYTYARFARTRDQ